MRRTRFNTRYAGSSVARCSNYSSLSLLAVNLFCALLLIMHLSGNSVSSSRAVEPNGDNLDFADCLEAELRLSTLGYWAGPIDGKLDTASRHALIAFQKVAGRPRTGKLTGEELMALREARRPEPVSNGFFHIEVDIARQVLFVIEKTGAVSRILPVSTGNEKLYEQDGQWQRAHTPRGQFAVYRKIKGWRKSPLGLLYYPNYIFRGIAIHGNQAVPAYPDSHGCIRIPMHAAKELSEMLPLGTIVIVYDGGTGTDQPHHLRR